MRGTASMDKQLQALSQIALLKNAPEDLEQYGKDWSMNFPANPLAVVFPESTEQVVQLVKWANETKTPLVPSGGRTGLSGAATASHQEVVVSFEKMDQILEFDRTDQMVRVEPGVITEKLHQYLEERGYFFPIDLAAKGSCQIGGNVATNAGGLRVLRYGMMRRWVSGLTLVTGEGQVLKLNKSLVKNATGFDLKNLVVGSEGTLGFITEVELRVTRPPEDKTVLILGLENLSKVIRVYTHFMEHTQLSACEVFSAFALEKVMEMHDLAKPFESQTPFYLLLEVEHSQKDISDQLTSLFEHCFEESWINDGVISQSPQQRQSLWNLREFISESLSPFSPYRNDVSVRTSQMAAFAQEMETAYQKEYPGFGVVWFGHVGDGNLHINILKPEKMEKADFIKKCQESDKTLFSVVAKFEGSISAEHGVGLLKKDHLAYSRSLEEIDLMRKIKKIFDPNGLLNPGKVF